MLEIAFRLPVAGFPLAVFTGDYLFQGGRLIVHDAPILEAKARAALEAGLSAPLPGTDHEVAMRLVEIDGAKTVRVEVDGRAAPLASRVFAPPTRSAWNHAFLALTASAAGFAASGFYLQKASFLHDEWAHKMGIHTAGWHLLLTFTLFPASVWGQRLGIRAVQAVSLLFFFIHSSIALANGDLGDPMIALFNAASGVFFFASVIYGQRAHRDMDPVAAFQAGRLGSLYGCRTEAPPGCAAGETG